MKHKHLPQKSGSLFVVAAPSGTGKTTLVKALTESLPNITVSISHTTREKRPAETHGINYYFIDRNQFQTMIDHGDFLEHAMIFGNLYGTSKTWVQETLARGTDVILEIDWQGADQIQKLFSDCVSIFILPPNVKSLEDRLCQRNQDKSDIIKQRLADAKNTVLHADEFDYLVLNDNFETAIQDLKTIILSQRLACARQLNKYAALIKEINKC